MSEVMQVAEHFAPGTRVAVTPRTNDVEPRNDRSAVKTQTVSKDGEVKLDGLTPFGQYWLSDGDRAVAINVPGKLKAAEGTQAALAEEQEARAEAQAKVRAEHGYLRPGDHQPDDTADRDGIPESNFEKSGEKIPTPAAKYVDMPKGTWQRQGADFGTAYPVDPEEVQPQPRREDAKGPQRDGADTGYAAPVDPAEVQPAVKYEDEKGPQAQGADTGTAVPVPKGSKKEQEQAKSSADSKARGATKAVAGTSKTRKAGK